MSYDPTEWELARQRGYVTAEEVERWTGTDRSTWWRRWWFDPDGITRWDRVKMRWRMWAVDHLGTRDECGCQSLWGTRLVWCGNHLGEMLD